MTGFKARLCYGQRLCSAWVIRFSIQANTIYKVLDIFPLSAHHARCASSKMICVGLLLQSRNVFIGCEVAIKKVSKFMTKQKNGLV